MVCEQTLQQKSYEQGCADARSSVGLDEEETKSYKDAIVGSAETMKTTAVAPQHVYGTFHILGLAAVICAFGVGIKEVRSRLHASRQDSERLLA